MSAGTACRCTPPDRAQWRVTDYKCNHSAFNGYHYTSSDYSRVKCLRCGFGWRTKAAYVDTLALATQEERLSVGTHA